MKNICFLSFSLLNFSMKTVWSFGDEIFEVEVIYDESNT
jgi:hypothetical protein